MNINEAKSVLQLYRPGTADAEDPQVAAALALAQREPELACWLAEQGKQQNILRASFQKIVVPAGLKEQIIAEQPVRENLLQRHPRRAMVASLLIILVAGWWMYWSQYAAQASNQTLAAYQSEMTGVALHGYGMDVLTNNVPEIRAYFARHHAFSNFVMPDALQKAELVGCAITDWQNVKVSMLCFRSGRPLPSQQTTDLWLFVVPLAALRDAPTEGSPRLAKVNGLMTAVWASGDRVYLLGTPGDSAVIQQFL